MMWKLVPTLVREMGQAFPELARAEALIAETLRLEETRFRKTLERGMSLLDEASKSLRQGDMFDGVTAFTLYDTYGFPLDLTQDAVRAKGLTVDLEGFDTAMANQRKMARDAWVGSGQVAAAGEWFAIRDRLGPTEFIGYDTTEGTAELLARPASSRPS